jgi:hypothetical protein
MPDAEDTPVHDVVAARQFALIGRGGQVRGGLAIAAASDQ